MSCSLKPFFCYYGGKWRAAPKYPAPLHETIVEPFAGAAGYSVRHPDRQVLLLDVNPIITGVWEYLIRTPAAEIARLPDTVMDVDELPASVPQEARWLIGFWLFKASRQPHKKPCKWALMKGNGPCVTWCPTVRERITRQVEHIRHWRVWNASYDLAPNVPATWFIDPPYDNKAGRAYVHKFHDYPALAEYCRNRLGQVIVCENAGAEWLPFREFRNIQATAGRVSKEVIWTNEAVAAPKVAA